VPRPSLAVDHGATALRRAVAGDLDTICSMALRKEPTRRYASVKQLCDDVQRHLDAQPVLARADTMTYRVSKFVRRNRVLVGATFAIMLALAIGLVIALLQYREALRASTAAKRSAYSANLEAAEAALRDGDARTALARLESAPQELRGWEWRHLSSRTDGSELCFPSQPGHAFGNGSLGWLGDAESFVAPDGVDLVRRRGAVELERVALCMPTGVSYAPRSRRVAWCGREGELRVAAPGEALQSAAFWSQDPPDADRGVVHQDVQWSPDERWLALSSRHGLRLYDGVNGALLHEFPNAEPIAQCGRIRWSPRLPQLARGNWDETVEVFDAEKRERVAQWRAHTMAVLDLAFDESGERLATCSLDRTAKVWDFELRSELSVVRRPRAVNAVAFLDDELVVGESNGAIAVLDWRSGEVLRRLIGHTQPIVAMTLSSDRSKLLSVGTTDAVRVWSTGARDVLEGRTCEFTNGVRSSPDGERFVTSSPDGVVRVWDTATCEVVCSSHLDRGYMLGVDWSRDGLWIATAHASHTAALWDAQTLELVRMFEEAPGWHVAAVAFAPDSTSLSAVQIGVQHHPGRVRSWSLDGRARGSREIPFASRDCLIDVVLDAGGETRLVTGGYVELDAWTAEGNPTRLAPFHEQPMVSATASRDGSLFAAAYLSEVFVARADDLEILTHFDTSADMVRALAFHPHEPRLAVSVGETIELWDYTVPFRAATLHGHQGPVTDLSWTPDGAKLISVSWDGGVRVWRTGR
jgi:WD40 repeat protein